MSVYDTIRDMYCTWKGMQDLASTLQKKGETLSLPTPEFKRHLRSSVKKITDQLLFPLTQEPRYHYDEDGESWTEYGIIMGKNWTYMECEEYFDSLYVDVRCDYSPTGRPFTRYIHWKRTPAGIAYAIHWGLDV